MRIGVLGGAFDPPHAAHAALARAAARQLNLDRVLWIPTFAPPHKGGPAASFADRTAMVRALVASLAPENPAFEVSDIEASLPQPSYTLHTLRALKQVYPDAAGAEHSWVLILGADNVATFDRWHEPEAVLAEASLAVYPRAGYPAPGAPALLQAAPPVMLNFPEMTDQSTEYREALAAGGAHRAAALERLPRPVAAYVRARKLYATLLAIFSVLFLGLAGTLQAQSAPVDSISPVFRGDSANAAAIRSVEAGTITRDSTSLQRDDSLLVKQRHRGPYIGFSAGVAFTDNSAKSLFAAYMNSTVSATDNSRVVQAQDPVQLIFPVGLVVGIPVFPYFDILLRTEHFWSRVNGLTQKNNDSPREFWYVAQGHLAGIGARYLVPLALLSVNGQPGLYAGYTHFWNFGPTGLYAPSGAVRAKSDPAGAGYEVQFGYQQDYDKRFTLTGGLSYSRLSFASNASWKNIVPTAPDEPATWTLQALRLSVQGIYQFGK